MRLFFICSLFLFYLNGFAQTALNKYDFFYFKKGLTAQSKGNYKDAIGFFTYFIDNCKTAKQKPYPKAYYWRAYAYRYIKDYKKAVLDFEYLHTITEPDADAALQAAKCYNGLHDYNNALVWLNKAYERAPRSPIIQNELGMTYSALNNNLEALNHFRTAFGLDSSFALAYNNAGAALYFKQDVELPTVLDVTDARKYFTQAIQKDTALALAWRNRGAANFFLSDYNAADNDLRQAEKLDAQEVQTKIYLGVVAMTQQNFARAREKLLQATEIQASAETAWEELGNVAAATHDYSDAIAYYEKAKSAADPKSKGYHGLMHYHIAVVYAAQNEPKKMYAELKKAQQLGAFSDRYVYQYFTKDAAFQAFRSDKAFDELNKRLYKLPKSNKFLTQFRWFKMRQGARK